VGLSTERGSAGDSPGERISLSLSFDSPVVGLSQGDTSSLLQVGGQAVTASWSGIDGSSTRTLSYTVAAGDNGQVDLDTAALQAALVAGLEDNGFTAGSPQEKFLGGVRPLGPGGIGFHPKVVGEVAPQGSVKGSNAGMATVPGGDGTLFQRKFRMGHYLGGIRS
jgi:hypothetical protein